MVNILEPGHNEQLKSKVKIDMARCHAPFDKKNHGAMYCRCALFHFFKRSVRSLGRRATTLVKLSNFDTIMKIKKMLTADRRKRKKGGDEECRSSPHAET